jgi:hypothetical protein
MTKFRLQLPDDLMRLAQEEARRRGIAFSAFIATALRGELKRVDARVKIPVFRGNGPASPGLDLSSNATVLDLLDEDDFTVREIRRQKL